MYPPLYPPAPLSLTVFSGRQELSVQEVTAKRADGSSFPVSVRLTGVPASAATPVPTVSLRVHVSAR